MEMELGLGQLANDLEAQQLVMVGTSEVPRMRDDLRRHDTQSINQSINQSITQIHTS